MAFTVYPHRLLTTGDQHWSLPGTNFEILENKKKRKEKGILHEPLRSPPPLPLLAAAAAHSTSSKTSSKYTANGLHRAVRGRESRDLWRKSVLPVPHGCFWSVNPPVRLLDPPPWCSPSSPVRSSSVIPPWSVYRASRVSGSESGLWFTGGGSGKVFMLVRAEGRLTEMQRRALIRIGFVLCAQRLPAHIVVRLSGRWEAAATWWDDSEWFFWVHFVVCLFF